jgi:outer membrane lipoprotein-sorting protein
MKWMPSITTPKASTRLFFSLFLSLSTAIAAAASPSPMTARELDQRLKLYRSVSEIEASFKQTKHIRDMDLEIHSSGNFKIKRPHQITWQVSKPSHVLVEMSPKEIKITSGTGPSATSQSLKMDQVTQEEDLRNIQMLGIWLNLESAELSAAYNILKEGPETFRFSPKETKRTPFKSLKMKLSARGHLKKLWLEETSGDSLTLEFGTPILR